MPKEAVSRQRVLRASARRACYGILIAVQTPLQSLTCLKKQPRIFHLLQSCPLASFAVTVSNGNHRSRRGHHQPQRVPRFTTTTQGRLRCTQFHRNTGLILRSNSFPQALRSFRLKRPVNTTTRSGLHGGRVKIDMPLSVARTPSFQHQPTTGRRKPTPKVSSMCPLTDF